MNLSKEVVREIVDNGCTISLPYKEKIDDYFNNIELCKRGSRYMILGEIYISKKTFDEILVEFSKFFDNIGMIQHEIVENTPLLDPDNFNEIKRLVYQRVRDIQNKKITFGIRKADARQRRNSCYGGRATQLKDVKEYYQTKKDGKLYGRRLK